MSWQQYGDNYPLSSRDICLLESAFVQEYHPGMKTFRDALLDVIETRGIALKSLADGAGVSYEQLKKLKQNKSRSTNVDDAARIAKYLGVPLSALLAGAVGQEDAELADLLAKLDPADRRFLLNAAKAQIAARDSAEK